MQTSGNIDDLVKRIEEKAESEAAAIIELAEKVAARDISKAKEEVKHKFSIAKATIDEQISAKREAIRAELSINERRVIMEQQEQAINNIFAESLQRISEMNDEQRSELLLKLAQESIAVLGVDTVRIKLNSADRELISGRELFASLSPVRILLEEETIDTVGGILVSDESGRLVHDNTFESRLARQRDMLRAKVADILEF